MEPHRTRRAERAAKIDRQSSRNGTPSPLPPPAPPPLPHTRKMEFISARSDVISQDTELPNPCNCDQAAIPVGSGWGRGVTVGPVGLLLPSGQRGGTRLPWQLLHDKGHSSQDVFCCSKGGRGVAGGGGRRAGDESPLTSGEGRGGVGHGSSLSFRQW